MRSPQVPIGETEAYFNTAFGGMKKADVTGIYFPIEDAFCLRYKINTLTFHQFWTRSGRDMYISALEQYNEAFDSKNLIRNSSKTRNLYGTFLGFLVWQEFAFTVQSRGNMEMELGYYFRKGSPFFTIGQGEAHFKNADSKKDRVSGEKPMYLTRAQAEEIAAFFDQEMLISSIPAELLLIMQSTATERRASASSDFDDY